MWKKLLLLSLLVNHSNYVMEALIQIRLNTDKSLAPYNTWLSLVQISHLQSINYLNTCNSLLLCIGLRLNEFCDILKGPLIMVSFSAKPLNFISMPLLMLIGWEILMIEPPRQDMSSFLGLIQSVGALRNKRQWPGLQLKLNIVLLLPLLLKSPQGTQS